MLKIYDIRIAIFIDFIEPSVYKGFQSKADLAQLVELLICNQWVRGSSPCVGTSFQALEIQGLFLLFSLLNSTQK